ncbi:MAG: hypothetical protein ACE14L_12640 [Terriglobales bacterium]
MLSSAILGYVLGLALIAGAQTGAPSSIPNLSGTWRLDRDLTTADLSRVRTDILLVRQSFEEIRFDYYDRDRQRLGVETFITDGDERPRYKTRIERAYARARWKDDRLIVRTRSFLDHEGYQSYSLDEIWQRSPDGTLLTNKSSDGKEMVYRRVDVREELFEP